ncbi:hypothetical protein M569_14414 [Genlisea aurea]|uniref:Uncharacterized protein n=1 Tax=Genlisea aurea TaxID=192259 RepID=S8C7R0_9LAMI|nr:hypothetical protein M569_14414 [Genlisea aurea]
MCRRVIDPTAQNFYEMPILTDCDVLRRRRNGSGALDFKDFQSVVFDSTSEAVAEKIVGETVSSG